MLACAEAILRVLMRPDFLFARFLNFHGIVKIVNFTNFINLFATSSWVSVIRKPP